MNGPTNPANPATNNPSLLKADFDAKIKELEGKLAKLDSMSTDIGTLNGMFADKGKIRAELQEIKKTGDLTLETVESVHVFQAVMEAAQNVGEALDGIFAAVRAAKKGDTYRVASYSLLATANIVKGVASTILAFGKTAKGALPFAVFTQIFGAVLDIVAKVLEYCAPEEESLLDKIENLLRQKTAEDHFHQLKGGFERISALLTELQNENGAWTDSNWKAYDDKIHKEAGDALTALATTASWLEKKENQRVLEDWTDVLTVFLEAHTYLATVTVLAFSRASGRASRTVRGLSPADVQSLIGEQNSAIDKINSQYSALIQHLGKLLWPARNASRLFSIGDNEKLYTTLGCILERREKNWNEGELGGEHDTLAVMEDTIREDEEASVPVVFAWRHGNGGDFEALVEGKWKAVSRGYVPGDGRSFDVIPWGTNEVLVTVLTRSRQVQIERSEREENKLTLQERIYFDLPTDVQIDGVVRAFNTSDYETVHQLGVALLGKDKCAYVMTQGSNGNAFTQVGVKVDWCEKLFARNGKLWAMSKQRVAWLPYDAKSDAKWNDASPNPTLLNLTGNWFLVDLEPPGESGLMIGALKHQLLFWTEELGWMKGNEDEKRTTFTAVRHAPDPVCSELIELRKAVGEQLTALKAAALPMVVPMGTMGPAVPVLANDAAPSA